MREPDLFEVHSYVEHSDVPSESTDAANAISESSWTGQPPRSPLVLQLPSNPGNQAWIGIDSHTHCPIRCNRKKDRVVTFAVVRRRLESALTMTPHREGVLVNGLPALDFTVLQPRDSIVIAPGIHSYVTLRIRPYVGTPREEMVGKKCPFCKMSITNDTRIVTCRCGVIYHYETEESHQASDGEDLLDCLSKVRLCLSCRRPVTLQEYLVWDPATLQPQESSERD